MKRNVIVRTAEEVAIYQGVSEKLTNEQLKKALELLGSKVLDIYTTEKEPDFVNTFIPFDEEKENIIIKLTK